MQMLRPLLVVCAIAAVSILGFLYSGLYPIGADDTHTKVVTWALETLRKQSVSNASKDILVPALDDPELLLRGGPDYNEMCASCHLKPGHTESDLSLGLYPAPPNLTVAHEDHGAALTQQSFWIIKHGIKASGMPAWGLTHDDQRIWAMVAFVQKLPDLTPIQYQILTARTSDSQKH